jgi:hypothetical protein
MCHSFYYICTVFAPLAVGHEVDTAAKSRVLRLCLSANVSVLPTLGRTFRLDQRKNTAAEVKSTNFGFVSHSFILIKLDQIGSKFGAFLAKLS